MPSNWLLSSVPPNSYKIQIAYIDTFEKHESGKLSIDDSFSYRQLSWQDTPDRFTNYSQANVYALKHHPMILYRIVGSNNKPNYFVFSDYKSIKPTPKTKAYIQFLETVNRLN